MNSDIKAGEEIGWVVDAQRDFMEKSGRLYVKHLGVEGDEGAVQVTGGIVRTVEWMRHACKARVFTADWHGEEDSEIDRRSPDFVNTFPAHCMARSANADERRGAELVSAVARILRSNVEVYPATDKSMAIYAVDRALEEGRELVIHKTQFSVFTGNKNTDGIVARFKERLGDVRFTVCGVATDVCVKAAVEGLLERGVRVRVVGDAMYGLSNTEALIGEWKSRGVEIISSLELEGPGIEQKKVRL